MGAGEALKGTTGQAVKRALVILTLGLLLVASAKLAVAEMVTPGLAYMERVHPAVGGTSPAAEAPGPVGLATPLASELPPVAPSQGSPTIRESAGSPANSLSLVLGTLGAFGAWQLRGSARRMQLGHVPAWFHAEAPEQIGHAVAAGPSLRLGLAVCEFEAALPVLVPAAIIARPDRPVMSFRQFILSIEGPRAPPVWS